MQLPTPLLPLLAALAFIAGCSKHPPRTAVFKVEGRAMYQGRPMAKAMIGFHPISDVGVRAAAETGPNGEFQMTSFIQNDGASAGEHVVTIFWPDESRVPPQAKRSRDQQEAEEELLALAPNKLDGKYSDPRTSPLHVTVKEQANRIDFTLP